MVLLLDMFHRQNNLEELYPLFAFLNVQPLGDWNDFSRLVSKPIKAGRSDLAIQRIHVSYVLLDSITLDADFRSS